MNKDEWVTHLIWHGRSRAEIAKRSPKTLAELHAEKYPDCPIQVAERFLAAHRQRWGGLTLEYVFDRTKRILEGEDDVDEADRRLRLFIGHRYFGAKKVRKFDGYRCVYCRKEEDLSEEHIPPQSLFIERPPVLPWVPACRPCNQKLSQQDDYFRIAMALACKNSPSSRKARDRIARDLTQPKRKKFASELSSAFGLEAVHSEGGVYLRHAPCLDLDSQRVALTLEKIAVGLYWRHERKLVKPKSVFVFRLDLTMADVFRNDELGLKRPVRYQQPLIGDGDVFRYDYEVKKNGAVNWVFTFFCERTVAVDMYPPWLEPPETSGAEWKPWRVGGNKDQGRLVFGPPAQ